MSLIPRNAFLDIDSLFDNFFAPATTGEGKSGFFAPRVDLKDKGDHYEVTAELPGVRKDDIHVTIENGVLSLEAETRQEDKEEKDGKLIRQERRYGKYVRSFSVGRGIKESDIDASFENGVLKLSVPKSKPEQETKQRVAIK